MLEIEVFTLQGCEGSGNFGHPVLVEEISGVKEFLVQLATGSRNGVYQSSDSEPTSPIRSQEGISAEDTSSTEAATQSAFATQAPRKVLNGMSAGPQRDSDATRRALLGLIQENSASAHPVADDEPPRIYVSPYKQRSHPYDHPTDGRSPSVLSLSTSSEHSSVSPTSAVVPFASRTTSSTSSTASSTLKDDIAHSGPASTLDISKIHKVGGAEDVDIHGGIRSKLKPTNRKTEKSLKTRKQSEGSVRNQRAISPPRQALDIAHEQMQNSENPWQGLSRIPRKYVQIPKDQRTLLERDDAWYSPVSGNGQPSVNVPPNVLLALQAFHGRVEDGESDTHCDNDTYSDNHCNSLIDSHLDTIETELEREKDVGHTEESQLQVNEAFQHRNVSLIHAGDVPYVSQDLDDGSSVEEAISWPSSSDRGDPSENHTDDRFDAPNLSQSQFVPSDIPPLESTNADSLSVRQDQSDREEPSISVSQKLPEHRPKTAVRRIIGNSKNGLKSFNICFSSSPVEMELSVPYALDTQNEPPDDVVMTDALDVVQTIESSEELPQSTLEVERTPHAISKSRSALPKTHDVESNKQSDPRRQADNLSFHPIIPSTFRSEASNIYNHPATSSQSAGANGLGSHISEADPIISATPGHSAHLHPYQPSRADDEAYAAKRQLTAETGTPSQKNQVARSAQLGEHPFVSVINHKSPVIRQRSQNTDNVDLPPLSITPKPSQLSVRGTRVSYSAPPLPLQAQIVDDVISSPLTRPVKRGLSRTRNWFEPSPKRRRPFPAVNFPSGQEKDPGEMAKANRRKFLQGLSLEHTPSNSNSDQHEPPSAQTRMASKAVIKLVSEDPVQAALLEAGGVQSSPASPTLSELGTASLNMETTTIQNHQYLVLHEPKDREETIIGKPPSNPGTNDENIQMESNGSDKGVTLQVSDLTDAESQEDRHDRLSTASTQLLSDDNYGSRAETVYDAFSTAYPTYKGSVRAFVRACSNLETLQSKNKAPHPSLWDDFIRAFDAEYMNHVKEKGKRDAIKAVDFYNNHVLEPVFMKRIMAPPRLQEALRLDPEYLESLSGKRMSQLSQESIPMTNSDSSPESQDAPVAPNTVSPSIELLSKPSAATSQIRLDNVREVKMISSDISDMALVPSRNKVNKRPFFETPSQVVSLNHKDATESINFSAPSPPQEARDDVVIERTTVQVDSPDIELIQLRTTKLNVRRLPWLSSPQDLPEQKKLQRANHALDDLMEVNEATIERYNTGKHSRNQWQPSEGSVKPREGSPILGSVTLNTAFDAETSGRSESSLTVSSKMGFRQDPVFKTPRLPASKSLGRRAASLPGPSEVKKDALHSLHHGQEPRSLKVVKAQNSTTPTTTASFKDFAKAFVSRQRRQSAILSRGSTPGSNPSPMGRGESETARFAPPAEPDTQVWRF